jgi:hypothetical protein
VIQGGVDYRAGYGRFKVEKNTEQKKKNHEETVSDQEIWWTIRYLDPDKKGTAHNIAVIVTLAVIFSICLACIVLHFRGD